MDNVLRELVERLSDQTRAGKIVWEDVSTLSAGDRFRVNFGDAVVDIRQGERVEQSDEYGLVHVSYIRLQVLNDRGFIVDSTEQDVGTPGYSKLSTLLDAARGSGRQRKAVLEKLLTTLSK